MSMLRSHPQYPDVARIANVLGATRQYPLDHVELARPSAFQPDGDPLLDSRGRGLPSVLAALKLASYARYEKIETALLDTVASIQSIVIRPTTVTAAAGPKTPGHRLSFVLAENGWEIPAEQASAGVLEAWLLADESALPRALQLPPVPRGSDPEALDGRRGSGRHPKDCLAALMAASADQETTPQRKIERIAEEADATVVEQRCPRGFASCAGEVRVRLGPLFR